ncbi:MULTISPECIES: hypothetical protein [unclassified Streptomyces]|uniref:hypothetical protein n=1 Tax=unclassified Streptomyces TaxID=2593676 RepID=UPI000AD896A0|nr:MULTISPECIES: hypothetical protein [unclassified Streptomyces]
MSGSPTPPGAAGVMGRGYGRHSQVQQRAGDHGLPLLRRALAALPLPVGGEPLRVADLGAATGANSLDPMRVVVESVRRRAGRDTPVTVVHTDIPANDFDAMFATVLHTPGSYAHEPQVFALAEARSFYEPLFPPGELHLAWSAIAVHWLSGVPRPVPDHIYSAQATGDVRRALEERSRADWEAFLTHRARELRSGGQLVVLGGAADDDGSSGAEGLMAAADAVLDGMVREGLVTPSEYTRMTIPTWNRTAAEFLAPLRSGPSAGDFRVEEHELVALPDLLLAELRDTGDVRDFAGQVTGFFQAAFQPSLFSALDPGRGPLAVHALGEAFASGMRTRVAADPGAVETRWRVFLLRLTRL